MQTLSIIIPTYNEENTLNEVVSRVYQKKTPGYRKQIIVVDDGSRDGSQAILAKWKNKCQIILKPQNEGKGSAIRAGLEKAIGDIILIQDADLEYSPDDYPVLLGQFEDSKIDVVYGSRFLGSHLTTMFVYAFGNKFVTLITNILYNTTITDMETGFKVFRKKVLDGIKIKSKKFDFEPEFTAKILKKGYQILEVPINYRGRKFAEGKKLTWRDGISAVATLIWYRFMD